MTLYDYSCDYFRVQFALRGYLLAKNVCNRGAREVGN